MKNLDLSTLPAKKRKQIVSCLRAGIQLLYFLFLPSVFTAAFNGVKYIFTQIGQGEKIEMTAFVSALLLVCASVSYTHLIVTDTRPLFAG